MSRVIWEQYDPWRLGHVRVVERTAHEAGMLVAEVSTERDALSEKIWSPLDGAEAAIAIATAVWFSLAPKADVLDKMYTGVFAGGAAEEPEDAEVAE